MHPGSYITVKGSYDAEYNTSGGNKMKDNSNKLNRISDDALEQVTGGSGNNNNNNAYTLVDHKCPNKDCPSKKDGYNSKFRYGSGGRAYCINCGQAINI